MHKKCNIVQGMLRACIMAAAMPMTWAMAEPAPEGGFASVTKPDRLVLLDLASVGKRLVVVGERGVIFRSDDEGKTWQGQRTATTRTLVAISFADEKIGVAVGHGGSLLRTEDGGISWTIVKVEEAGLDSLLGVTALGLHRFVAYGAFGLYIESNDGGKSWIRHRVISDEFDRHISKVIRINDKLLLVGESGTLATSADGVTWHKSNSPYEGSWFGGITTPSGAVLIFGMRGNVYRSEDAGMQWTKVGLNAKQGVMNALILPDGGIVLVGNAGFVARSDDDGRSFRQIDSGSRASLAQGAVLSSGELIAVSARGVVHLKMAK